MAWKTVDVATLFTVGPLIDDTDFKTLETAIAYDAAGMDVSFYQEQADGTITKTALTLTTGGTQDWAAVGDGYYSVEVTAAQNNTECNAWVAGVCTGVLPFESGRFDMVPANVVDSLVKGTDRLQVDVLEISSDSAAADNAEAFFDGTGYAGTNNVMPTTTTVTNTVSANTIQISGDSVAADNAEAFFDGTGYAGTNNVMPTTTTVTNTVNANAVQISGDSVAADNAEAFFDGTGYAGTNNVIPTTTTVTNAVTTSERRVQGAAGIDAAGLLKVAAWLEDPDGSIVNATAATFELLDYDDTSVIGTGAWTVAPTETANNLWYANKTSVTLTEGEVYKVKVVITSGSAYTRYIPLNAVA